MIIFSDDDIMSQEECAYCIEKMVSLFFDVPKIINIDGDKDGNVNFMCSCDRKSYEYMYDKNVSISWYDLNNIIDYIESYGLIENQDYYVIRMGNNPVCIGVLSTSERSSTKENFIMYSRSRWKADRIMIIFVSNL